MGTRKLDRIEAVGQRIYGDRRRMSRGVGWEFMHVSIDDRTRFAYVEMLQNKEGQPAADFLAGPSAGLRSRAWPLDRVMTDNGSYDRPKVFVAVPAGVRVRARHLTRRSYTPRSDREAIHKLPGKAGPKPGPTAIRMTGSHSSTFL